MIVLLQRVRQAWVEVNQQRIGEIQQGVLALVGLHHDDTLKQAQAMVDRLLAYRIFADADDKMNLSVVDIAGGLLLVPQFTLAADTDKGRRPSFSSAMVPAQAAPLFQSLCDYAQTRYPQVAQGQFGADMQVHLQNDGPVSFILQS